MRHVGQAILGVINVRLLLLESMILFLSREPFMKACLTNTSEHNWAQVVNLLWITLVLSAITYIDWFVNCIIYLWLLTKSYIYIYIYSINYIFQSTNMYCNVLTVWIYLALFFINFWKFTSLLYVCSMGSGIILYHRIIISDCTISCQCIPFC